eukprot:2893148-Pleurochrysis_carterae.AAC.1
MDSVALEAWCSVALVHVGHAEVVHEIVLEVARERQEQLDLLLLDLRAEAEDIVVLPRLLDE